MVKLDTLSQKKRAILADQRGMAMLITIMTVSLLVAVTVMFHRQSWQSYLVAHNYKVATQLKAIGDSGANIGLEILRRDLENSDYDSLLEGWATLEKDDLAALFSAGRLELRIIDLSGKLQVNSLVQEPSKTGGKDEKGKNIEKELRKLLLTLLLSGQFAVEESEAEPIVDALVDWLDKDDRESDKGAESSYYQSLKKPYECRNGPVQYIEELLLVKGISRALLFGEGDKPGLVDYLTVYGEDGKININTADVLLIKSMNPLISDELIERLHTYRLEEENGEKLAEPKWYSNIGSWPGDIVLNGDLLTTKSTFFLIKSTAKSDSLLRYLTVAVNRVDKKTLKILSRKVD